MNSNPYNPDLVGHGKHTMLGKKVKKTRSCTQPSLSNGAPLDTPSRKCSSLSIWVYAIDRLFGNAHAQQSHVRNCRP